MTGVLSGLVWVGAQAQSLPEMIGQVVELQALERSVQQGYRTVTSGLGTIGNIRNAEFGLHSAYFGSLDAVKPVIKNYAMKRMYLGVLLGLVSVTASSQSVLQLTEQLVMDTEKLGSMKQTLQDMYQGYEELQQGYSRVRDIAKGNFSLHQAFLDALWVLSPAVRNDPRVAEIINTEYQIVAAYQAAGKRAIGTPVFTAQELDYIIGTYSALLQRSMQAVEELTMILTDNELQMSDAQRLQAIDRIDADIRSQLGFLERFDTEVALQAQQRQKEGGDINTLKSLYGISY